MTKNVKKKKPLKVAFFKIGLKIKKNYKYVKKIYTIFLPLIFKEF